MTVTFQNVPRVIPKIVDGLDPILEVFAECCVGSLNPTRVRGNERSIRRLLKLIVEHADLRLLPTLKVHVAWNGGAQPVYDPTIPEGRLLFEVPDHPEYSAILEEVVPI